MNKTILALLPLLAVLCITPLTVMGTSGYNHDPLTVTAQVVDDRVEFTVSGILMVEGNEQVGVFMVQVGDRTFPHIAVDRDENGVAHGSFDLSPSNENGTYYIVATAGIHPGAVTTPLQGGYTSIEITTQGE